MKELCRWCTHYHPDERYKGTIGICDVDEENHKGVLVSDTCDRFLKGEQVWMCGEKVVE